MIKNIRIPSALLTLLLISSCGEGSKTCPLFFHPDEVLWDPAEPGDVLVFANQVGEEVRYELKSTIDDKVAEVPQRFNCRADSTSNYYDDGSNIGFSVELSHTIPDDGVIDAQPLAEQSLYYTVQAVKEDTTVRDESEFLLTYFDSESNNGTRGGAVYQYSPMRTINGTDYNDVLERDLSANEDLISYFVDVPEDAAWVRVVVAKGVGLVQYELLNGAIYTRTN